MDKEKASQLIKAIAEAIKSDPGQFQFNVNVSGMNVSASNGSTGMIVSAHGGGPGSHTTGLNVSLDSNQIEIVKKTADSTLSQQMTQLYQTLIDISNQLNTGDNARLIEKLYKSLKNTWVPGIIISVVGNLLSWTLGIAV